MALNRNKTMVWGLLGAAFLAGALTASAQQLFTGSAGVEAEQVEKMYVKGADFLAKTQGPEGNWPDQPSGTQPALTGVAVVSILAHGDDPNLGHTPPQCIKLPILLKANGRDDGIYRAIDVQSRFCDAGAGGIVWRGG